VIAFARSVGILVINTFTSMNKAKAAGINASSFFDLKAQLAKQEDEFAKKKKAGLGSITVGGVKRPEKVTTSDFDTFLVLTRSES
jgi:hypothetical protein